MLRTSDNTPRMSRQHSLGKCRGLCIAAASSLTQSTVYCGELQCPSESFSRAGIAASGARTSTRHRALSMSRTPKKSTVV
eukprot:1009619-Rhodomonas_salina.1